MKQTILSVKNLHKKFGNGCHNCEDHVALNMSYCTHCHTVYALKDINIDLYEHEILGIVGESGSGKSTLVKCLYFDMEPTSGSLYLRAYDTQMTKNLYEESDQKKHYIKNHFMGMVYQNPYLGLKMHFSSISNVAERMIASSILNTKIINARAQDLMQTVKLPINRMKAYPIHFSGGMQQRVQIAKALSTNPPVLFLDEITTGLDLSVQASVLDLIRDIKRHFNVSMILVSHDLSVIRMLTDRTIVMHQGKIVEIGLTDQILEDPQHPYTQTLVQAIL
jgi:putative phosphonate transport system ATP-binding protein